MTILHVLKLRLRIVAKCAGVILSDKSLLFFPFVSMAFASILLCFFYFTVGADKMQLMLNTLRNEQGVQSLNLGYYGALAVALYLVVAMTTAMNFALSACVGISLEGQDSKVWDGISLAIRRIPAIFIWSLLSLTLGLVWTLLDQERRSSSFLRRKFGNTWNNMSMLTVPATVFEDRNVVSSVLRSRSLVSDTWGTRIHARFGSLWIVLILCSPLLIKYFLILIYGSGVSLPFAEFSLIYVACALIMAETARGIFKVALYRYAVDGQISKGFDKETLEEAFCHPDAT